MDFLKEVLAEWRLNKTSRLGAALSFYTIFAIAPLFLITLSVAGMWFGDDVARRQLFGQIDTLVGHAGGDVITSMVTAANRPKAGTWATVGATITLGLGAIAVFVQLKSALNTIWHVKCKPGSGVRNFIKDRLLSFAMVLVVGFLLLVSLVLNAALSGVAKFDGGTTWQAHMLWKIFNFAASLGVVTLLFALILKMLPDVKIAWRDVWVGAFVTAVLFNLGKFLIGYYLGRSSMVTIYGAAGSFIILLLWVYYSAQILFFGAEFTRIYSLRRRSAPQRAKSPRPAHHFSAVQQN